MVIEIWNRDHYITNNIKPASYLIFKGISGGKDNKSAVLQCFSREL